MTERYSAQICLPEIGKTGQKTLGEGYIVVIGAGGLGATILPVLVGGGVGHIHILDDDVVEEGNLHRQTLYRMSDIGFNKAERAVHHLRQLNPGVSLIPHPVGAQYDVMFPLLRRLLDEAPKEGGRVIVLDAADNFATTYMLSDLCCDFNIPLISASAIRWGGYAGIFCGNFPSYRAVFPGFDNGLQNCQTAGVLGPVVGLVGMLQAQLCFSLLLNISPSPAGKLYRWDAKELRMSHFSFMKAEEPKDIWAFLAYSQLKKDDLVIDVRAIGEQPEIIHKHLCHIPIDALLGPTDRDFPKDNRIVLCCQSGARAMRAASYLYEQGYRKLAILAVGHQKIVH